MAQLPESNRPYIIERMPDNAVRRTLFRMVERIPRDFHPGTLAYGLPRLERGLAPASYHVPATLARSRTWVPPVSIFHHIRSCGVCGLV